MELKELDFQKARRWVKEAKCRMGEDSIFAFIAAWIGFNYYYSTFMMSNEADFKKWSNENCSGRDGDKAQWKFLVSHPEWEAFFTEYKRTNTAVFDCTIEVPVYDDLKKRSVPAGVKEPRTFADLSSMQILEVLYQIRNNLFHGRKNPEKDARDKTLCQAACAFMVPFLMSLIDNTQGEVSNAYEPQFSWDCPEP